ncbi:MAG: HPr family phosphocarrier protein [Propionibacteriaceae bacterium]|jgi:phosphocarrier protein|nr:HPr family phosphocarrier protein [Propionibacteriaceae bacterium]
MATRTVAIASAIGLHARPASLFAQAATASGIPITIGRPGQPPVDGRSILMVMALGVQHGEEVELASDAEGAETTLDALVALLSRDLDAE